MPTQLGLVALAFPGRPALDQGAGDRWALPVLAHGACVHAMVLRPRGVRGGLALAPTRDVAFRPFDSVGTPIALISRLNSPACTSPVNASPAPSRPPAHDSGSPWVASPSMSDSFLPYSMPVYPGAPKVHRLPVPFATDGPLRRLAGR